MIWLNSGMKRLLWLGSSNKDLKAIPGVVQDTFGYPEFNSSPKKIVDL